MTENLALIMLLEKQGFESYTEAINDNLVHTFFQKMQPTAIKQLDISNGNEGWDKILQRFTGNMETVDVRQLEMPLPMLMILDALDKLPEEKALYVIHKRIPVFLLPELVERKFDYRIREIALAALENVVYQEIGLNVVDFGLIYQLDFNEAGKKYIAV